jgi:hypothetical protein
MAAADPDAGVVAAARVHVVGTQNRNFSPR